jgi:hypothetical protein
MGGNEDPLGGQAAKAKLCRPFPSTLRYVGPVCVFLFCVIVFFCFFFALFLLEAELSGAVSDFSGRGLAGKRTRAAESGKTLKN